MSVLPAWRGRPAACARIACAALAVLAAALPLAAPDGAAGALPGRNGDLVFTTGGAVRLSQLRYWRIHPDGTGRTRITAAQARRLTARSPDGRLLAEAVSRLGLVVQSSRGGARRVIVKAPDVRAMSWFPDGRRIAFLRGAFSGADLFTVHADGRRLRRLTRGAALERVAVSPTGREIAVGRRAALSGDFADWDLVAIRARDGRTRVVERSAWAQADGPGGFDWSPDGGVLAIARILPSADAMEPGGGPAGMELVRRDGSGRRLLSPPGAIDANPFFSPDGRLIAFEGFCAGAPPAELPAAGPTGEGICVMRRDGTGRRAMAETVLTPGAGVEDVGFAGVEWGSPWLRAARATAHPPSVPPMPPPYALRTG
jgi:WD40-like Beta Propeller Repeat